MGPVDEDWVLFALHQPTYILMLERLDLSKGRGIEMMRACMDPVVDEYHEPLQLFFSSSVTVWVYY